MGTWWQQIGDALRADCSDLPNAGHVTHIVIRLAVAAL